jgi:thioredoxin 1
VQTLSSEDFDSVITGADLPVLVDFWAEWCPPCRVIEPILERLATDLSGRVLITKINSDENPEISARYRVLGLPTLLLFVGGEPVTSIIGARSLRSLRTELEPHLPAGVPG